MRYSRWARSEITFGPLGRVVATMLVCLPLTWFAFGAGFFGVVGLALWLFVILPWALRDIWQRVPTGPRDPLGVGESLTADTIGPVDPETSIGNRTPPARW